jgi:predicted nucleic acid-binding protein
VILYLDTSSLVKLYIEEAHSDLVRDWIGEADLVATGRISYPEALSAVVRRFRSGDLSREAYERVVTGLEQDWDTYSAVDFDEHVAARMVLKHRLRGADAIHLSSAVVLGGLGPGVPLAFSSFDAQLNRSARAEGLHVLTAR